MKVGSNGNIINIVFINLFNSVIFQIYFLILIEIEKFRNKLWKEESKS